MSFENKVVLITGAAGGIGLAAAEAFAKEGAKLVLVDLSKEALEEKTKNINAKDKLLVAADVSKEEQVQNYVEEAKKAFGTVDVFINNAGINGAFATLDEQTVDNYQAVFGVNVLGAFLGLKHVAPIMKEQKSGAIVNTASNGGLLGAPRMGIYAASKHAVIGLNKTAALELADFGIRVNAVAPSGVDTQMMKSIESNAMPGKEEDARTNFENSVPLKRYSTPEEIADLMVFLASDKASFISGAYYRIDGGQGATSV
ncbi:SDR family NAD(P)-dependent oxidoreductase [Gracilibacillus saliphilus]|uniref:SDR family NAD(P)-dependent oxidoreductase n=1 Tax=Gracilibacillus saliphilus TaxID=543890 RepID=UPI0013D5EA8F|nr:SDR family oxidoreductase [Gracilibacillus saliphilus]